jgi:hypothetical protein
LTFGGFISGKKNLLYSIGSILISKGTCYNYCFLAIAFSRGVILLLLVFLAKENASYT